MEKQAVCAQGTTKATEGMGARAARTWGLKEPIQAEEPPIPTASRDPGARGGSALQGTSEPRSSPMGMISPRPSDPTESRDPSAEAPLSTDMARGCGKLWGRSARPGPVSREPRSEHGREFRRGSLRGRFLGRPRSLGPPSSQKMTPTLHSRAISSALLLQPREANTLHLCGMTPSPSSWTQSVPRDGVMAKECRAPVTAGSLLGDAVFEGAVPLDVLVGKVCWPLRCQGRAEGISFPPAQERAEGSLPDLRQLLFPNWDNSNSGLPRRGLSDKLVSTLGRQHLPVGSYTLCSQTPTRPSAALPNPGLPGSSGTRTFTGTDA